MTVILFAGGFLCSAQDRLLVMGPETTGFSEVLLAIREELDTTFDIRHRTVTKDTPYARFELFLEEIDPKVMVLMNNATVAHYKNYQIKYAGARSFPPAIVSMALFIDDYIRDMENTIGVSYEVPAITCFNNLRDLIGLPVERIGVIHRQYTEPFVKRQIELCKREQFELVPYKVPPGERNLELQIRKGLRQLISKDKVDAIWVLNDSHHLNQRLLQRAWIPKLKPFHKPVVVGVEPLINYPGLGNFAVLPDHIGLGHQVAGLVLEAKEAGWKVDSGKVKYPVSVEKYLRVQFARQYLEVKEQKLDEIDVLIK